MKISRKINGFTLVELTIAFAIASFGMMILTIAVIHLYKLYEQDTAVRTSEQSAWTLSEQLTRDMRASAQAYAGNTGSLVNSLCLVSTSLDTSQPGQTGSASGVMFYAKTDSGGIQRLYRHALSYNGTCDKAQGNSSDPAVTPDSVYITQFKVTPNDHKTATVDLSVASSSDWQHVDLTGTGTKCTGAFSQYCSVTTLPISVEARSQ